MAQKFSQMSRYWSALLSKKIPSAKSRAAVGWVVLCLALTSCGPGFKAATNFSSLSSSSDAYSGGTGVITVAWQANREKNVNSTGGGYRVYYTQVAGFKPSLPFKTIPYVSGTSAPVSTTLNGLIPGTYHLYVVGFSTTNASGSAPSIEATAVVH
jgi:hypothetical protein